MEAVRKLDVIADEVLSVYVPGETVLETVGRLHAHWLGKQASYWDYIWEEGRRPMRVALAEEIAFELTIRGAGFGMKRPELLNAGITAQIDQYKKSQLDELRRPGSTDIGDAELSVPALRQGVLTQFLAFCERNYPSLPELMNPKEVA